jgi:uncharacterized repeat protein (TIGR03803 family)
MLSKIISLGLTLSLLALTGFMTATLASAQSETVLHSFDDMTGDGELPTAGLVSDASGNLYGTANNGGTHQIGAVFELISAAGGGWTETLLHSFSGADGFSPFAGLILDAAGNLYGTTEWGGGEGVSYCGQDGCGTVFEMSRGTNGRWIEKVLHRFNPNGTDGLIPFAGLIFDTAGNVYGTTALGGAYNQGTVFELTPKADGSWSERILHNFNNNGTDGEQPRASLIFDAAGNLYGTTYSGGVNGDGSVFELSPKTGGGWAEHVLHSFSHKSTDGRNPFAGLIFDGSGNLYGTTVEGGSSESCLNSYVTSCGTVFELMPHAGGGWSERVLHNFVLSATDGVNPQAGLIFDNAGNLYGTTYSGGAYNYGTAFELTPTTGGVWTETLLHSFGGGTDASSPSAGLNFGPNGNLYGTGYFGGAYGTGAVFVITP